jgi:hypothetical protein
MDMQAAVGSAVALEPTDPIVYLTGRPPINEFTQYVKTRAVNGHRADEAALVEEWRTANAHLRALEKSEAGCADNPTILPLPDSMVAPAAAALDRTEARLSYQHLPHQWALVEIDQLIVTQKSVNLRFVEDLKNALSPGPSPEALIALAVGKSPLVPKMRITPLSKGLYSFSSPSADLRFLETALLETAEFPDYAIGGYPAAVLAIFVGFGVNFISAVRHGGRLILMNGTHRLYALRELGVRQVPCLVREAAQLHDLTLVGAADVEQAAQLYVNSPRPPLFKDYFDPRLHKSFRIPRNNVVLQLQVNMQQWRVPTQ